MIVNLNKDLRNDKILKDISQFIFLSVILIDSLFGTSKNLHLRVLLEICKNKENEMPEHITGDREILWILIEKILLKKTLAKRILVKKFLLTKIKHKILIYKIYF